MNRFLIIAALGCVTPLTFQASAEPISANDISVTKRIHYDDLNLASPADRSRLEHRIAAAATRVCAEATSGAPAPPPVDPTCYREIMKQARNDVDRAVARASRSQIHGVESAEADK